MSVNQSDLDGFHQFASQAMAHREKDFRLDDLVKQWHVEREREETIASIQRGVDDAGAGRLQDAAEVDATIQAELGFPARQR
ncbi:MAG TPA: hypothetical protein VGY55_05685 [Pirellulales bacterium]|jgi:predicted transcriptional regulator|nr:hypothetical protein [Pirellulales bacterium]